MADHSHEAHEHLEPEGLGRKTDETIRAVVELSRRFELKNLLQGIVETACALADAEFGALGIATSPDRPMDPWVFTGLPASVAEKIGRNPRPVGVLAEVALKGKTARLRDVRQHPAFGGFPEHHPMVTSLLGMPIVYEGRSIGVLYLGNRRGAEEFSAEDELVIKALATHASALVAQVQLRSQIAAERSQLEAILNHAPHGILHVGADGRIVANPAADALLGQPLGGRTFQDYRGKLVLPDGRALSHDEWPPSSPTEAQAIAPDGRTAAVRLQTNPVRGARGEPLGQVVVVENIGPWKELHRLREEFAAVVAHDLRNPINTIMLQVELLLRGARDDAVQVPVRVLERLRNSADRLTQMVNDLLDATRIEAERLSIQRQEVSLAGAVPALVERIRPTLGNHPVQIAIEGEPLVVAADPVRLDQILTNLIENAAKYSEDGAPIALEVRPKAEGAVIAVSDRGPGIGPEDLPHLFDRFYQAKRAREKKTGLGLGLYITKGLVEAHGGRLDLETELGRGSTFSVWLPCARSA